MSLLRHIPSIEILLQRDALRDAAARDGHDAVVRAVRQAADALRHSLRAAADDAPTTAEAQTAWIERRALDALGHRLAPSLRRVINATGVLLHTNLGRAPLPAAALEHAAGVAGGYTNLEYDLAAGARGHRHVHAERLLVDLTGAEAALVVNNNAAATMLVLASLAAGREVVVSRGELVEIGGGFRVPDVMAQSGALLREVGTTNRTRVNDYAVAIGDRTALILRVHPSNFRIDGFTERPPLGDLAALGRRLQVPVFEDLGSGWLGLDDVETPPALADEPSVRASIAAGADLVAFSGDKLLGGPQAGIVAGRRDLIDRARRHPLMRALRADKLTYATLEATLALWAQPARRLEIPLYRMLTRPAAGIDRRAQALAARFDAVAGVRARVIDGSSTTGGGSAPESRLPTRVTAISVDGGSASALEARLRAGSPPVVARIQDDEVLFDLRTVDEQDDEVLAAAIAVAAQPGRSEDRPLHSP
jgi:L-seryl-tRNA(Ser) seleniumtransferase